MRIKQRLLVLSNTAADRPLTSDNLYAMEVIGERLHDIAEEMVLKHKYDKEIKKNGRLVINHLHEMYDTPIDYLKVVLLTRAYELLPGEYQPRTAARRPSATALKRAVYSADECKRMDRERREREKASRKCLGCNKRFTAMSVVKPGSGGELSAVESIPSWTEESGGRGMDEVGMADENSAEGGCEEANNRTDTYTPTSLPDVEISHPAAQSEPKETPKSTRVPTPSKRSRKPRVRLGVVSGGEIDSEDEVSHSDSSASACSSDSGRRRYTSSRTASKV
ncbi:hypothetical protein SARC_09575 [Sphaeroforma arctica JP610]|uniref:Uncharacterized protein n=1 Tax=Sphaeroforma arctica JP610 TaxID=667725 RepID=A0A0L0FPS6_9EUKA|nr:hypothetical protein SARC_09575 [Sphaeroforma arctica JP610]KNC77978.1 hypothetical protein SARC_09575 [Sphaeroforma arctica JP610]|eukprot:XP_014151880.1 hypothetical protein SARC_09575 [Sphaeroforma arctica JP610]